jgi:Protein of unknown function (DUF1566)
MRKNGSHLASALGALALGAVLFLAIPVGAMPLESWDDKIPNGSLRFKVLTEFNSQAVLDKETGLVWEQHPASTTTSWENARSQCTALTTGGRKGWRLPSVHELQTLIDPTVVPALFAPMLPVNHPFTNVTALSGYWTATSDAAHPGWVWGVSFFDGSATGFILPTVNAFPSWCVRGGNSAPQY